MPTINEDSNPKSRLKKFLAINKDLFLKDLNFKTNTDEVIPFKLVKMPYT